HVDHVLDVDEIALLLAVAVAARADEQLHLAAGEKLVIGVVGDRRHAPLVRLVRPVDVEVAEAGDLGGSLFQHPSYILVKEELRIAVHVERLLAAPLLAEFRPRAVDRGRRGVDQRRLLVLAPLEQALRVFVVVLHHVAAVALHGVGACALMEQRLDRAFVALQVGDEVGLVDVVGDLAVREVAELVRVLQVVDRDHLGDAAAVQALDQLRADEAGRPGDDAVAHLGNSSARVAAAVPSLPTTMPAARLAMRTAASSPAPAASITARVAMTVSPAPVTSMTSRFSAATEKVFFPRNSVMPCSPRVSSSASSRSFAISACARALRSFSSFQVPTTSRSSAVLGVMMLAPL